MSEKLNRLLEYEKRLIQDRQKLMELLSESEGADEELVSYKLECFQKEIAFMNRQVELLKQGAREVQESAVMPVMNVQQPINAQVVQAAQERAFSRELAAAQEATQATQPMQQEQNARQTQPAQQAQSVQQTVTPRMTAPQTPPPAKKDLEQTVGKSLMGIFASVLIFISLILFATLLLPYFNDTAKMITTYIVSFAFLGVGLFKMKKDRENKFFMALTGCGIGALYISLLLSNLYFKVLGDIPLYVLICIWGVAVCLFAKHQNWIFRIIGEIGITISVLLGCVLCMNTEDPVKMLAVIIFYVISSGVFYIVHFEKEFIANLVHHISNVINVYALAASTLFIVGDGMNHFGSWVVLALVLVSIGSTLWHTLEKEGVCFGVFGAIYAFVLYGVLESMLVTDRVFAIATYVVMIALMVLYTLKDAKQEEGKYIVQTFLLIFAMIAIAQDNDLYHYGMVPMLILPAMCSGFIVKNPVFRYGSPVMLFVYTFEQNAYTQIPHFLLEGAAIAVGFGLILMKKERYSKNFKYALHVLALLFLFTCTGDVLREVLPKAWRTSDVVGVCSYVVFTLFNIAMMKSIFGKNPVTGEKENPAVYNLANMLAMVVGTFMIGLQTDEDLHIFWHMLLILTVLGAFFINAKKLLDKRDNLLLGIYVGIKFTILLIAILSSFQAVNYVTSIACLLLAIGGIVLGFVGEYKSLRIFGLLLSMVSIFKLIMVDISYDNTLGHAVSFFVSGILCFVISLIYNYIDKRFAERA